MPRSIVVVLKADLADKLNPGDSVVVVGQLVRQWKVLQRGIRCNVDMVVEANSVNSLNSSENVKALSVTSGSLFKAFWERQRERFSPLIGESTATASANANGMYFSSQNNMYRSVFSQERSNEDSQDPPMVAEAEHVSLLRVRDFIVRAVCPHLYGLFFVKLSLLLTLIGGTSASSISSGSSDSGRDDTTSSSQNGRYIGVYRGI